MFIRQSVKCGLRLRTALAAAALIFTVAAASPARGQWSQWGGPTRDFKVDAKGLADKWPEGGPKKLWSRDFGQGYSSILIEGKRLYTMHNEGGQEKIAALDAETGKMLWEHGYAITVPEGHEHSFGIGPRATPLIVGDRLFGAGMTGILTCVDKKSGKPIWSHDLTKEYKATFLQHGYSSSPVAYKDTIILPVGGKGHALMAFDQASGSVRWSANDFDNSYSSPKLIKVGGEEQLVCFMGKEIVGVDPSNGALKWKEKYVNQFNQNVMLPVFGDDGVLFISAPQTGSTALRLKRNGDKTEVEKLWSDRKLQVYHAGAVRVGDTVYASNGTMGPAYFFSVDVKTGKTGFRDRKIPKATCVCAGERLIILDEEGNLILAKATPEKLTILSKVELLEKPSWTAPTLVDGRLYLRDKFTIMALDVRG